MKQTAVEWLVSALDALDEQMKVAPKTTNYKSTREYIIKQAKEMEKRQIVKFSKVVLKEYKWIRPEELSTIKRLYNETFKTNG